MFKSVAGTFPLYFIAFSVVATFFNWLWVTGYTPGQWMHDEITGIAWYSDGTPYLILFCAFGIFFGGAGAWAAVDAVHRRYVSYPGDEHELGMTYSLICLVFTAMPAPFIGHPTAPPPIRDYCLVAAVSAAMHAMAVLVLLLSNRSELLRKTWEPRRIAYLWLAASALGSVGLVAQMYATLTLGWAPWLCLLGLAAYAFGLRAVALAIHDSIMRRRVASYT